MMPLSLVTLYNTYTALPTNDMGSSAEEDMDTISLSSWSLVNSACPSDDENGSSNDDDQEHDTDEIYHWQGRELDPDQLIPLTLTSLSSGFTHVSRATTARSSNCSMAAAAEHRGVWLLKVNKRKTKNHRGSSTLGQVSPTVPDAEDQAEPQKAMSEYELAKSCKAGKIKNGRLASQYDRDLVRALGITDEADPCGKKTLQRYKASQGKNKTRCKKDAVPVPDLCW